MLSLLSKFRAEFEQESWSGGVFEAWSAEEDLYELYCPHRLFEIGDRIFGVFYANREVNHGIADTHFDMLFRIDIRMNHTVWMFDQGFGATQADSQLEALQRIEKAKCLGFPPRSHTRSYRQPQDLVSSQVLLVPAQSRTSPAYAGLRAASTE